MWEGLIVISHSQEKIFLFYSKELNIQLENL